MKRAYKISSWLIVLVVTVLIIVVGGKLKQEEHILNEQANHSLD